MASRRLRRTKSFTSYLGALTQDLQDLKNSASAPTIINNFSVGPESLENSLVLNNKSIESASYVEGVSVWKIDGTGVAEFSDVFVRGDINASSGTIGYWNISNPDVVRRIGNKDLYGTFLESSNLGASDYNKDSGTYVGLYKSYIDEEVTIVSVSRRENVVTAVCPGHRFRVSDLISVTITDDVTMSTGKSAVRVIEANYNNFKYIAVGDDVTELTGENYSGTAILNSKDVAGLYLQDYGRALFDYGYFSNEGIAYVSSETPNLVYNASFEELPAELSIFANYTFTNASWLPGTSNIIEYEFGDTNIYSGNSGFGAQITWDDVELSTYLRAKVNESDIVKFDFYKNDRELYLSFDIFFLQDSLDKIAIPTTNSFYTTSSSILTIVCPGHGLLVDDLVYFDFQVSATGYYNYTNSYRVHKVLSVSGDEFTVENKFGTTTANPVTLSRRYTTSGPVIFKYIQPVFDLDEIKISFVTDNSDPEDPVLDSTTSLSDILTDVTLADWEDYRYWTQPLGEFENWYAYSDLLSASASYRPMAAMGVIVPAQAGGEGRTRQSLDIKISSAKLGNFYRSVSPLDLYDSDIEFYLAFPEWMWEGTLGANGSGTEPVKRSVKAVSTAGCGYIIDNVSISPSKKFFYGDSGPSSFYYKREPGDLVKTNKVSYEAPRKWIDIDLEFQTAELKYLDSIEFKSSDFLRQLYLNPGINTIKTSPTVFGSEPQERLLSGLSSVLNVSSGQYRYLMGDGITYRTVEAYTKHETGTSSAIAGLYAHTNGFNAQVYDGKPGAGFGVSVNSADKGDIFGWADNVRFNSIDRILLESFNSSGEGSSLWLNAGFAYIDASESETVLFVGGNGSYFQGKYTSQTYLGVNNDLKIDAPAISSNELVSDYQTVYISTIDNTLGYVSSSIRTKKNVEPLQLSISSILSAEPVQFNYKSEEDGTPKHAGFIAEQLIESGLDNYVSFNSSGEPVTVNYEKFVSALQLVAREQAGQITELTDRIAKLEAK